MKCNLLLKSISFFLLCAFLSGCNKSSTDIQETGQQVGDVMASIDESGGSGGSLGRTEDGARLFQRLESQGILSLLEENLFPSAYATACGLTSTFGSCSSNVIVRTFGGCTIGAATLSGTVTLTWGGSSSSCAMAAATDTVTRVPAFTLTGRRGATLTVSKTGSVGQRLTWDSGKGASKVFSFTNDGIRRVFTAAGSTLFDFTTQTTSAITVTGTNRSNRVLSGGSLRVTNNLNSVTCDYAPTSVAWTSTCTCAASGSWSGSCSDGKTSTITLTGCGTATLAIGSDSEDLTFDRCYGV